jgi:hypothetical protein
MTTANGNKKYGSPLPPSSFAFGGGTKPVSQLMFNKYDLDHNGKNDYFCFPFQRDF